MYCLQKLKLTSSSEVFAIELFADLKAWIINLELDYFLPLPAKAANRGDLDLRDYHKTTLLDWEAPHVRPTSSLRSSTPVTSMPDSLRELGGRF